MNGNSIAPTTVAPTDKRKQSRGNRRDRTQAIAIQKILEQTILDPNTPAQSRASCAAAWTRIQEAKRIMDGKPLPGQLRPELMNKPNRKPRRALLSIAPADLPTQSQQSSNASS